MELCEYVSQAIRKRSCSVGAIADAIVAYAQPLIDETDGSLDSVRRAMAVAQTCWNLAILSESRREAAIDEMKPDLNMTDEKFAQFRQDVLLPMIQRHFEMFPGLHGRSQEPRRTHDATVSSAKNSRATGRNDPCPCGSGRKYKRCCGTNR
jgi:uncharacterized protein YecA (UPF0149 family)